MTPRPDICPLPEFEQRCDRLILAFRYASGIKSPFKRRLFLNLAEIAQNLPRSECRKLFDVWLAKNSQNLNI